jgi:hypothetical protein
MIVSLRLSSMIDLGKKKDVWRVPPAACASAAWVRSVAWRPPFARTSGRENREVARYAALAGAASAAVKIINDVLRAWRTTGRPAHNQTQASAFEITDPVIEDAGDWSEGPFRSFG